MKYITIRYNDEAKDGVKINAISTTNRIEKSKIN